MTPDYYKLNRIKLLSKCSQRYQALTPEAYRVLIEKHRRWRQANLERARSYSRKWKRNNREKVCLAHKKYHKENRELRRLAAMRLYKKNKAKRTAQNIALQKRKPEASRIARAKMKAKYIRELSLPYLKWQMTQAGIPITDENIKLKQQSIRICRTKHLFTTMATAAVLK